MPRPNLFIVGAMKAGTTSLHNYLNLHSKISMSEVKEIHFFSEISLFQKGYKWYENHFLQNKIIGESSQTYSRKDEFPDTAKRIFEYAPDAKIIYIIREPWERLLSQYKEFQSAGTAPKNLQEYLSKDYKYNDYVTCSCYGRQIKEYLNYFPSNQIKVLKLEDLNLKPQETLEDIYKFLELQSESLKLLDNLVVFNASSQKKRPNFIYRFLFSSKFYPLIKSVIPKGVFNYLKENKKLINNLTYSDLRSADIDDDLKQKIKAVFNADIGLLEDLLGHSFQYKV